MNRNISFISLKEIINRVYKDGGDIVDDITEDDVILDTIELIGIVGIPKLFENKITTLEVKKYRALLPCDLISIIQVKDDKSGICLRSMTDSFIPKDEAFRHSHEELAFKTQGRVIFTSFPEGKVTVAYKAIPVDDEGFPLLIDNETYLDALEAYIKKQVFTVKFDQQKIAAGVLQNAQQEYAVAARLLLSEFTVPSVSEMESISRMWESLIPRVRQFDKGYKHLGDRQYIRNH